jgi:hypothetical protein
MSVTKNTTSTAGELKRRDDSAVITCYYSRIQTDDKWTG